MENNVLGIEIVRNVQGFSKFFECNSSQLLSQNIYDIREFLQTFYSQNTAAAPVTILTGLQSGYIITVASLIGTNRVDDSLSAWIYVPVNLKISGAELEGIINEVKHELTAREFNPQRLRDVFSRSYETSSMKTCFRSAGTSYGYRKYGQNTAYSLKEILNDLNQPYYNNHKHIILLDNAQNQLLPSGIDLTYQKILERCKIEPPMEVEGFKPYVNDQLFLTSQDMRERDELKVVWKREGFNPIIKTYIASKNLICTPPTRSEMQMVIPYDAVVVKVDGKRLPNYTLCVNNVMLNRGENIVISIDLINASSILVCADGYNEYRAQHSFAYVSWQTPLEINLQKRTYPYAFQVYSPTLKDYVEFPCNFDNPLRKSPFKGYKMVPTGERGRYLLKYRSVTLKSILGVLLVATICLIGGAVGGWFASDWFNLDYVNSDKTSIENQDKGKEKANANAQKDSLEVKKDSTSTPKTKKNLDNKPRNPKGNPAGSNSKKETSSDKDSNKKSVSSSSEKDKASANTDKHNLINPEKVKQ